MILFDCRALARYLVFAHLALPLGSLLATYGFPQKKAKKAILSIKITLVHQAEAPAFG